MKYSWKKGLVKTLKNGLILFGPAILAFLAKVPPQYAPIAGLVAYYLKNWYETTTGKKIA